MSLITVHPLVLLLVIPGVSSADWGVSYSRSHICALKDSSVIMSCTYSYPTGHQIREVFWTNTTVKNAYGEYPDLSKDPEYSQRLQYLGDKQWICSIRLSHLRLEDSHMYYFRFTTYKTDGKWIGSPGVRLSVTDLQLESPERVTEGDSVRLTCKSSCELTDRPTIIWYRNSQILTGKTGEKLSLSPVRREDAGRYRCAVRGLKSEAQLNVRYPPDPPVTSISGPAVIVEGDSVTLSCSSDSNPPAEIHWFKGGTIVGSGRIYSISKISSDDSGEYKCKANNTHGVKYSAVTLNVMYKPRSVSVLINGSAVIVEGDSVTLICSSDSNPPALNFSWFQENQSSAVGSGQSFSARQSGRFYCQAHNRYGSHTSDAVSVTVHPGAGWHVWLGIILGCLVLLFVIISITMFIMKKRRAAEAQDLTDKQENVYSDVKELHGHVSELASVSSRTARNQESEEEVQYVTVHHQKNTPKKRPEEDQCHYGNIRIHQPDTAARRSNVETVEDASVIYSSVK